MNKKSSQSVEILNTILGRTKQDIEAWERSEFDNIAVAPEARMVLCGAGGLGRHVVRGLRSAGVEPLAFADNNKSIWGGTIEGVRIISPEEAIKEYGDSAIFVITVWNAQWQEAMSARIDKWTRAGCKTVTTFLPIFWKYASTFLPYWGIDLPHQVIDNADTIRRVMNMWDDEASQKEFLSQVQWRLNGDWRELKPPRTGPLYFELPFFRLLPGEVFVDCGAYDGDTLRDFLKYAPRDYGKFIAIEPDPANRAKLTEFVGKCPDGDKVRISILPFAAYSKRKTLRFSASSNASSSIKGDGALEVQGEALSTLLETEHPTYLKMDIEGGELDALFGSMSLVRKTRPILAVSVYHVQSHLWDIPKLLEENLEGYSYFLIPHQYDAWDLVCYAIPRERCVKAVDGSR